MSEDERISSFRILLYVAGVIALMALAGGLGYLLAMPMGSRPASTVSSTGTDGEALPEPAPLYLYADARPRADLEALLQEVTYAAEAGIHRYVLVLPVSWGDTAVSEAAFRPLARISEIDPLAEFVIALSLNPPGSWLRENGDAAAFAAGQPTSLPSVCSDTWLQAAEDALTQFIEAVQAVPEAGRVNGYLIHALKDGRWYLDKAPDDSPACLDAFREWLATRYETDAAIQAAWGDKEVTLEGVAVPEAPAENGPAALRPDTAGQRLVDYARFVSERTAGAIERVAGVVKDQAGEGIRVFIPYGFTLEALPTGAGHFALARLLRSPHVDGFVSPVSYYDRGVGGAGGFMGPIHSARLHGKQWFILDDTRTGIARDPGSGRFKRQAGLQTRDVYKVQRRNFAAALANGIGLFWADPAGVGCLADEEMWQRIATMRRAYRTVWPAGGPAPAAAPLTPSEPSEEVGGPVAPAGPRVPLMAVVDERSRVYLTDSRSRAHELLVQARDCVLRSGVPSQFCLLSDVLDGTAPPAAVYVILNAFHLTQLERDNLIAMARRNRSALIWMYAPGYLTTSLTEGDDEEQAAPPMLSASVDNVAATTLMPVKAFEEPTRAGSAYSLEGVWMNPGNAFGEPVVWDPLFYIEGEELFTLATYRDNGKSSVAIEFFEDQWASVFVAEPSLSVNLLREILRILEEHIYLSTTAAQFPDVCHFGPDVIAIHASTDGERILDLDVPRDAFDLLELDGNLEPILRWTGKQYLTIPMTMGETRVLKLSETELPPVPAPVSQPPDQAR